MVLIPEKELTTENAIESIETKQTNRSYLSMSGIGEECIRKLWMDFRWCTKDSITARVKRIYNRGDIEEARIIVDLKSVGVEVYRLKNTTINVSGALHPEYNKDLEAKEKIELFGTIGEEQEEIVGFAEHAKGHPDGRCLGVIEAPKTEHLLEIKTMADKYFQQLKKNGLKASNPKYYSQMQRYMGGMKLTRALFIATNKNDESRYYKRVKFDKPHYEMLLEKERNVILSEFIPKKQYKQTWYLCRFCKHRYGCHHGAEIEKNCRTCKHVDLANDGVWSCGPQNDKELSLEEQRKGCQLYKLGIEAE